MSLFYMHYNCYEGALVMRKSDGTIYRVRGNVGLWNMTAILEPWDAENNRLMFSDEELSGARVTANSKQFAEKFLILDPGEDRFSEALKIALSQIAATNK